MCLILGVGALVWKLLFSFISDPKDLDSTEYKVEEVVKFEMIN